MTVERHLHYNPHSLQTETPKAMSRRGSNQSVSNITLSQTPKAGRVLSVGIIGHAAGICSELRERSEDEEETILEEDDDEIRAEEDGEHHSWKGPLYISPFCQIYCVLGYTGVGTHCYMWGCLQ